MKSWIVVTMLFASFLFIRNAESCGDKFLVLGKGLRYERAHAAAHPASILIYAANPDSVKELKKTLELAGHKTTDVSDEQVLFSSLDSNKYDIVLVNLGDAPLLETKIMATSNKPTVLPVIYSNGSANLDASANQYPCVLKYKDKNKNPVAVIDEVMDDRIKGKPMECNWSK